MATKVDSFVERAAAELAAIRAELERTAGRAQALSNRWAALGKTTMPGWAEYNWVGQPFTAAELAAALNGLAQVIDSADATSVTNINAAKVVDKIVKASL